MASVEEIIAAIGTDIDAVSDMQGRVEASRAYAQELFGQLQETGVADTAAAIAACKEQLVEAGAFAASVANKLVEARTAAESAQNS